ncbi:hypothetical protein [Gordonia aichiensis]
MRGKGVFAGVIAIGVIGVVWAVVDVIDRGWASVPGSTWVCAALGLVLVVFAVYREFGGQPLVTVNDENIAEEYEAQKRADGLPANWVVKPGYSDAETDAALGRDDTPPS